MAEVSMRPSEESNISLESVGLAAYLKRFVNHGDALTQFV
jgi:hypothetical protein